MHDMMAFSSDAFVADIRKCENNFKDVVEFVARQADNLCEADGCVLDNVIESLDSSAHSLGVMAAL